MQKSITTLASLSLFTAMVIAGCSNSADSNSPSSQATDVTPSIAESTSPEAGGHGEHGNHPADGGSAPAGIAVASNPKFPVGSTVVLSAEHMSGMAGATATVVGAYDTYTYSVDSAPGAPWQQVDHKWVVHEEIADAGSEPLTPGTEVTLLADHMTGMKGSQAIINQMTEETVYMVDFEAEGMVMKNHKWVVESEMTAAE